MNSIYLKRLIFSLVAAATFSSCIVAEEHRVERPRGCRHAEWVGSRRHGHWECHRPRRHAAIIVR